jgi:hypothetical protein
MTAALVGELARLGDGVRRQVVKDAQAERKRRIRDAIRTVRSTLLEGHSARSATREIDDAVRRRRTGHFNPAQRRQIKGLLVGTLGDLSDFPAADRIRQLIDA